MAEFLRKNTVYFIFTQVVLYTFMTSQSFPLILLYIIFHIVMICTYVQMTKVVMERQDMDGFLVGKPILTALGYS